MKDNYRIDVLLSWPYLSLRECRTVKLWDLRAIPLKFGGSMKNLVAIAFAGILLLASTTNVLAVHGVPPESDPLPLHGSVWFGSGLERFVADGEQPLHGSVWFGNGLAHYGVEIAPVNSHDTAMILRGSTHGWTHIQPVSTGPVWENSFDAAMIVRGSSDQPVGRNRVQLAVDPSQ